MQLERYVYTFTLIAKLNINILTSNVNSILNKNNPMYVCIYVCMCVFILIKINVRRKKEKTYKHIQFFHIHLILISIHSIKKRI